MNTQSQTASPTDTNRTGLMGFSRQPTPTGVYHRHLNWESHMTRPDETVRSHLNISLFDRNLGWKQRSNYRCYLAEKM